MKGSCEADKTHYKTAMRLLFFLFIGCFSVWLSPQARADYADVIEFFDDLHGTADAADFPVSGRDFSDIESAFGPRVQTSGGNYDWHRGIDIDGTLNTDPVVAALDGYFYDYRTLDAGGYIVILEHRFADFGVFGLTYEGKSVTRFYTWYLHLYDDGLEGNDTSTDDIVSAFTEDDPTFTTKLVVPSEWLQGFESPRYRVDVTAVDILGQQHGGVGTAGS